MITCIVHSQYYSYYYPYSQYYYYPYPYYPGYYYPPFFYYFYPGFIAQSPTTTTPRSVEGNVLQILQKYAPIGFTYLGLFREFLTELGK
ncbi:Zinc finger protein [Dirofilaria immitis]